MNIVIRTEVWSTRKGQVIKAVARTATGQLLGATNQTSSISPVVIGRK
jgi:hypothetical protein